MFTCFTSRIVVSDFDIFMRSLRMYRRTSAKFTKFSFLFVFLQNASCFLSLRNGSDFIPFQWPKRGVVRHRSLPYESTRVSPKVSRFFASSRDCALVKALVSLYSVSLSFTAWSSKNVASVYVTILNNGAGSHAKDGVTLEVTLEAQCPENPSCFRKVAK